MKSLLPVTLIIFFSICSVRVFSQAPTQWGETFSGTDLSKQISIIYDNKAILKQENGELKIGMSKDSAYHVFLYQFDTIDVSKNPYVSVKLKTSTHTEFYLGLVQDSTVNTPASYFVIKKDSVFNNYYFDFSDLLVFQGQNGPVTINSKKITGIYFIFSNTSSDSLAAEIDEIKIGSNVPQASVATGFEDDFNDNIVSKQWVSERKLTAPFDYPYIISETGGALVLNVFKEKWNGLWFYPQSLLNISDNPVIEIRAKASSNATFRIFLWDNKNFYEWCYVDVTIRKSNVLKTYYLNFQNKFSTVVNGIKYSVDSTRIKALLINLNPGNSYSGVITLDEIKIGDKASKIINVAPTIQSVPDIYLKPNAGMQSVTLHGITFGDTLGFQEVYLDAYTDNNQVIQDQMYVYFLDGDSARLEYSPAKNATGTTTITVRVSDNGGTAHGGVDTTLMSFKVIVQPAGIKDASQVKDIQIYPSPVQSDLFVNSEKTITNIVLQDVYGREIVNNHSISALNVKLDLSALNTGVYILQIARGEEIIQKKILR